MSYRRYPLETPSTAEVLWNSVALRANINQVSPAEVVHWDLAAQTIPQPRDQRVRHFIFLIGGAVVGAWLALKGVQYYEAKHGS